MKRTARTNSTSFPVSHRLASCPLPPLHSCEVNSKPVAPRGYCCCIARLSVCPPSGFQARIVPFSSCTNVCRTDDQLQPDTSGDFLIRHHILPQMSHKYHLQFRGSSSVRCTKMRRYAHADTQIRTPRGMGPTPWQASALARSLSSPRVRGEAYECPDSWSKTFLATNPPLYVQAVRKSTKL
ncbi:hypothetical protein BP00DRAFT_3432 [Aspergillus indologenus CBS 114.80]|uniref:Uncharacterized protein n=1 Tax=Aspergillus indologenus CBS 114.80 TaxID=1450541 RepID=A0A2V5IKW5_9EURO|nr:hypothetical protein BP00DRAFT_3432 [Aspergillus indologenus CBS 114.80]